MKSKKSVRNSYAAFIDAKGRRVKQGTKGARKIRVKINREALKFWGQRRSKAAKKKRLEKRAKQLRGKRSAVSRKHNIRSRKGKRGKPSTIYNIPFSFNKASQQFTVDSDAVKAVFDLEAGNTVDGISPVMRAWVWISFKDEPDNYVPTSVGFSIYADEPNGAREMEGMIDAKLFEYDVFGVDSIEIESLQESL